jgi:hypothetical protein
MDTESVLKIRPARHGRDHMMMFDADRIDGGQAARSLKIAAAGNAGPSTDVLPLLALHPIAARSASMERSQEDGLADEDSPMIAAVYERHLCMDKMVSAFAEMRGDEAPGIVG